MVFGSQRGIRLEEFSHIELITVVEISLNQRSHNSLRGKDKKFLNVLFGSIFYTTWMCMNENLHSNTLSLDFAIDRFEANIKDFKIQRND